MEIFFRKSLNTILILAMRELDEKKLTNFNFAMRHSIKKQQAALHLLEEKINQRKTGTFKQNPQKSMPSGKMVIIIKYWS